MHVCIQSEPADELKLMMLAPARAVMLHAIRYPGLPCCYQTRLVQFDAKQKEFPRKAYAPFHEWSTCHTALTPIRRKHGVTANPKSSLC